MKIVFMGSPEFAVPSLNALVEGGREVICVYSQPPRPAGRGKADRKTAVHERAEQLGMEVRTPRTLRDAEEQERFRALDADLAVVAAYGLILPRPILDAPKQGCINVHASLLPRWRGAAPIQRAILAGDKQTGITLMQMEEGLDTGPMLRKGEIPADCKNAGQLTEELSELGAELLTKWLAHPTEPEPQTDGDATYAKKIEKSETRIDWTASAEQVERQVRAFNPVPGAWFVAHGERLKLLEAEIGHPRGSGGAALSKKQRDSRFCGNDGLVVDDQLLIQCGQGAIRPIKMQRAGRAPMTAGDLLRGFAIPKGTILE